MDHMLLKESHYSFHVVQTLNKRVAKIITYMTKNVVTAIEEMVKLIVWVSKLKEAILP